MGLKKVPGIVQLPGGVKLNAVPFRIVEWDADGAPKMFELQPPGTPIQGGLWGLFADEAALRAARKREP